MGKTYQSIRNFVGQHPTVAIIVIALGLAVSADRAEAQGPGGGPVTVTAGAFEVQFWNRVDGDVNILDGDGDGNDDIVTQGNLGTWTADERTAIVRSFQYWTGVLALVPNAVQANRPVVRLVKDDGSRFADPTAFNANALPVFTATGGGNFNGSIVDRLINNNNAATRVDGIDARLVFQRNGNTFGTDRTQQLTTQDYQLEPVSIHEIGHILGFNGADQVHLANVANNTATGANAVAVHGGAGVPLAFGDAAHTRLEYHNLTRGQPFGVSFRNIPHFAPAELAVYRDMGYIFNLNNHFGTALYQPGNGVLTNNATVFNSAQDYGIGLFFHSDNQNINQTGNITAGGFAGTGIRITGRDTDVNGNDVTIANGVTVSANGNFGIGVLASSGSNHNVIHRGTINATGASGRGIVFDFGPNLLTFPRQINSTDSGIVIVDALDISGTINATTNAIEIGSTAAINEINLLTGTAITGNIVSNSLTGSGFVTPTMSFGRTTNADGTAGAGSDAAFNFVFANNILGNPVGGVNRAVLNLDFFEGTTTFNGNVAAEAVRGRAGMVTSNGTFDAFNLQVDAAMMTFAGDTNLQNITIDTGTVASTSVGPNSFDALDVTIETGTFTSTASDTNLRNVIVNGAGGTFNVGSQAGSTGDTTVTSITQNNGTTTVTGTGPTSATLNVTGDYIGNVGTLVLNGANANMTANTITLNGAMATANAGAGSTLTAGTFNNNMTRADLDGTANITNYNSDAGTLDVGATGMVNVTGILSQTNMSTTNVAVGGTLTTGTFNTDNSTTTVAGTMNNTTVNATNATTTVNGSMTTAGSYTQTGGTTTVNESGGGAASTEFTAGNLALSQNARATFNGNGNVTGGVNNSARVDIANGGSLTAANYTQLFGVTNVTNGTLNSGVFQQTDSTLNVAAGSTWNATSVVNTEDTVASRININGTATVTNLFDLTSGGVDLNPGSTLNAGSVIQRAGLVTIDPTSTVNATTTATINGGTLALNGTLNSNTFTLNQNGTLIGNGNLTGTAGVTFNGTVSPGNSIGAITVTTGGTTTFAPTATTRIELNPAGTTPGVHNDLINVNGTATVNGGTLAVTQLGAGTFGVGDQYTFLQTTGGVTVNNRFNLQEVIAGRRFIQLINPNDYSLVVARSGLLSSIGTTPNAQRFGTYLGAVSGNPQAQTLRTALDLIADPNAASFALQSLGGELYASVQTSLMQANSSFLDNLNSTVHGGGHCCGSFAENPLGNGFWNSNYGWGGTDGSDGNAQTAEVRGGGTAIGFGRFLSDTAMFGFFYNAERLDTDIDQLNQSAETETHRLGVYHESRFNSYYLRGVAAAGYSATESQRNFQSISPIAIVSESPRGDFHSWNAMVDIETGWCVTKPQVKIEPLLGLRYIHVSQEGFAEQGGPLTNLIVNKADIDSLRARAGARFSGILPNQATVLSLETFWQMDIFEPPHARADARLAIAPTSSYFVQGPEYGAGRFVFSPSIRHQWGQHTNFFFRYRGDWADGAHRNAGEAGLEVRW